MNSPERQVLSALQPALTEARAATTRVLSVLDEHGHERQIHMPAERPLTLYLDRRELVTLMTLGAHPELLALGYLRNQRLVASLDDVVSVQADWSVDACAIVTRSGVPDLAERTAHRIVTTGCGQGTVYGHLMDEVQQLQLPDTTIAQSQLYRILDTVRLHDSIYKKAGSVHGCALFHGDRLELYTEDVGRHNALDALSGWMWLNDVPGAGRMLYTTGRLTSEMVIKAAQMGVAIVASRSGATEMGLAVAEGLGMTLLARAVNRHFLLYCGRERFRFDAGNGDAVAPITPP